MRLNESFLGRTYYSNEIEMPRALCLIVVSFVVIMGHEVDGLKIVTT